MKARQRCYYVLSTSKLVLFTLIPALMEYTSEVILVATTNTDFEYINTVIVDETHAFDYSVMYAKKEATVEEFITRMKLNNVRVGVVNTSALLFSDMLKCGNGSIWLSACREGLFSYLPKIYEYATDSTLILCFDNDNKMIERAHKMYAGSNLSIHKCVAHSICSKAIFDLMKGEVVLLGGEECRLWFPPEVKEFEKLMHGVKRSITKRVQVRFSKSQKEFDFYTMAKAIDINGIHTAICIMAYVEGYEKGISLKTISEMQFNDLLEESTTLNTIICLHSLMFDKYLQETASCIGELKITHSRSAWDFVKYLFSEKSENVGRGLDYGSSSAEDKLDRHLALFKGVDDTYFRQILYVFEKIF